MPGQDAILKHIRDENRISREMAIRSLANFRDESMVPALLDGFAREKVDEVRAMIVVTLGAILDTGKEVSGLRG